MDFIQTVETIKIWIASCKQQEQLNLCRDVIDRFVTMRFKNHVTPATMATEADKLYLQISDVERVLDHK